MSTPEFPVDRADDGAARVPESAAPVSAAPASDRVTIHRSPRYFRFMIAGGIVGVIVALILTFAFPEPPGFNPAQIFGFLAILFVIVGVVVGSVVALAIDRASRRRQTTLDVERVTEADADSVD